MRLFYPINDGGAQARAHYNIQGQDRIYVRYYRMYGEAGDPSSWIFNPSRPMHNTLIFAGQYVSPTTTDLTIYEDNHDVTHKSNLTVKSTYQSNLIVPAGTNYTVSSYPAMPHNITNPISFVPGVWYEIQYMAQLNTPGQQNGELKLWVNGILVTSLQNLVLRDGSHSNIQFDHFMVGANYPPSGPTQSQSSYIDDIVISTSYIPSLGATADTTPPAPPVIVSLTVN